MRRVARRVRPWGSPLDIIASVQDCIVYTRTAVKYRSTGQSVERGSQRTQHNGPPALGHPWPAILQFGGYSVQLQMHVHVQYMRIQYTVQYDHTYTPVRKSLTGDCLYCIAGQGWPRAGGPLCCVR